MLQTMATIQHGGRLITRENGAIEKYGFRSRHQHSNPLEPLLRTQVRGRCCATWPSRGGAHPSQSVRHPPVWAGFASTVVVSRGQSYVVLVAV